MFLASSASLVDSGIGTLQKWTNKLTYMICHKCCNQRIAGKPTDRPYLQTKARNVTRSDIGLHERIAPTPESMKNILVTYKLVTKTVRLSCIAVATDPPS